MKPSADVAILSTERQDQVVRCALGDPTIAVDAASDLEVLGGEVWARTGLPVPASVNWFEVEPVLVALAAVVVDDAEARAVLKWLAARACCSEKVRGAFRTHGLLWVKNPRSQEIAAKWRVVKREHSRALYREAVREARRVKAEQERARQRQRDEEQRLRQERAATHLVSLDGRLRVFRRQAPSVVELHVGPTNSGKTTGSLVALVAHIADTEHRGWFAAPLRMLAQEAAMRVAEMLDQGDLMAEALAGGLVSSELLVGVMTGEEQINPEARIVCGTPEMIESVSGDMLVIDEAHWVIDPDRGWAWTNLILSVEADIIHILGDTAIEPMVNDIFPGAVTMRHERRSTISFAGQRKITDLQPRTAVVAFSRKAVLGLTKLIERNSGRSVAALYGALPPATRRSIIDRFNTGEVDVLVTTDVIGHGLNLGIDEVCFAEGVKFDGEQRRRLAAWEAGQIAGRCGRDRLPGTVSFLVGPDWFDEVAARAAATTGAAVGGGERASGIAVKKLFVRPRAGHFDGFDDIGVRLLPEALKRWAAAIAQSPVADLVAPAPLDSMVGSLTAIRLIGKPSDSQIRDVWSLMMMPVDPDSLMFSMIVSHVLRGVEVNMPALNKVSLESAEAVVQRIRDLRCATVVFPDMFPKIDRAKLARLEASQSDVITSMLASGRFPDTSKCSCGKQKVPWFDQCDACHNSSWARHDDWDW